MSPAPTASASMPRAGCACASTAIAASPASRRTARKPSWPTSTWARSSTARTISSFTSNGDLYFTDPPYGLPKHYDDPARELDFCGVYLRKKDGKLILLTKELSRPNGIALSPDEKTLYVANSDPATPIWMSFPVKADGTLGKGKVFFDGMKWVKEKRPGLPDGMKVDAQRQPLGDRPRRRLGLRPDGTVLGNIDTGTNTANCASATTARRSTSRPITIFAG